MQLIKDSGKTCNADMDNWHIPLSISAQPVLQTVEALVHRFWVVWAGASVLQTERHPGALQQVADDAHPFT